MDGIDTKTETKNKIAVLLGTPYKIQGWKVLRDFDINEKFRILAEFVTANFCWKNTRYKWRL